MADLRHALVLGLGCSGIAAARLLRAQGWRVHAIDAGACERYAAELGGLRDAGVTITTLAREIPDEVFELAVTSPGIPIDAPWHVALRKRGVSIVPEFEWGCRSFTGRTVAVTGSNGKSSIVTWIRDALQCKGATAVAAGNIGFTVCEAVMRKPAPAWFVLELSSFQLEQSRQFRADIGILLNLVPNHLDRHADYAAYANAKAQLFQNTVACDLALLPAQGDGAILNPGQARVLRFGRTAGDIRYVDGIIHFAHGARVDLRGTYFGNPVLGLNAASAAGALIEAGVPVPVIEASARDFTPLPHRMEDCGLVNGVRFINDSKSTTLSSLAAAVEMCASKVRLLAGGRLKESDIQRPKKMLEAHATAVYVFGESASALSGAWSDILCCSEHGDLDAAFAKAVADAKPGEFVLLSPGCASFDQFTGYAGRGERFRELVKKWRNRNS